MGEVVRRLAERYDWSGSIPNFTMKLKRGSLKYREAVQVADVLGYDLLWQRREASGERNPVLQSEREEG